LPSIESRDSRWSFAANDTSAEGESAVVDHTVKSYDKDLDALERRIAEMGGLAEKW
jgi:hypothetical protein